MKYLDIFSILQIVFIVLSQVYVPFGDDGYESCEWEDPQQSVGHVLVWWTRLKHYKQS